MKDKQILNRPGGANGRTPDGWGEDKGAAITLAGAASPSTHESVPRFADTVNPKNQDSPTPLELLEQQEVLPKLAFSMAEAAWSLSLGISLVKEMCRTQRIRSVKIGKRRIIPRSELERIASHGLETQP